MNKRQRVETGDVTRHCPRSVTISGGSADRLDLVLDDTATVQFSENDWEDVAYRVDAGVRLDWLDPRSPFQLLQNPDLSPVIRLIDSTPSYQLFKAAFEIAQILRLVREPSHALRRLEGLSGVFTRYGTRGSLYFPTRDLLDAASPDALTTLVSGNKLCLLHLDVDEASNKTYYVPYATPVGQVEASDDETKRLWDRIREEYRAVRDGRPVRGRSLVREGR